MSLPVYKPIFLLDCNLLLSNNYVFSSTHLLYLLQLSGTKCFFFFFLFTIVIWVWANSPNAWSFIWNLFWACACVSPLNNLKILIEMPKMLTISQLHHNLQSTDPTAFHSPSLPSWPLPRLIRLNSTVIITPFQTPWIPLPSLCFTCLTKPQVWLRSISQPTPWLYSCS